MFSPVVSMHNFIFINPKTCLTLALAEWTLWTPEFIRNRSKEIYLEFFSTESGIPWVSHSNDQFAAINKPTHRGEKSPRAFLVTKFKFIILFNSSARATREEAEKNVINCGLSRYRLWMWCKWVIEKHIQTRPVHVQLKLRQGFWVFEKIYLSNSNTP